MSDIYLQITETPTVVTLSAPVVASVMVNTVTVANVVSVNVVTMPAITVQAAAPSVTTVAGTVTIGSCVTHGVNVANSVTISSLPAISGTVTANVFGQDCSGTKIQIPVEVNSNVISDKFIPIGYNSDGDARQVSNGYPLPVSVDAVQNVYKIYDGEGSVFGLDRTFPISGTVDVNSLPSIVGTVTANLSSTNLNSVTIGVRGTVTANIGNSITVGSLPVQLSTTTIGGTARLNVTLSSATTIGATVPSYGNLYGGSDGTNLRAILVDSSGRTTVTGSVSILGTSSVTFSQIAGAVTMYGSNVNGGIVIPSLSDLSESPDTKGGFALLVKIMDNVGNQNVPLTNTLLRATAVTIAGTVTANNPNGALTTRFGSVVTANTAGITTAVTNTSRKYLLAQNISTGTVTIGIGFSPTTTQGIQLTSGAGLTFDSFVPTGAVYWLGATTGAAYTILEG